MLISGLETTPGLAKDYERHRICLKYAIIIWRIYDKGLRIRRGGVLLVLHHVRDRRIKNGACALQSQPEDPVAVEDWRAGAHYRVTSGNPHGKLRSLHWKAEKSVLEAWRHRTPAFKGNSKKTTLPKKNRKDFLSLSFHPGYRPIGWYHSFLGWVFCICLLAYMSIIPGHTHSIRNLLGSPFLPEVK